jgi:hypothetical protein
VEGTNSFIPIISHTLQGWGKDDPPTEKSGEVLNDTRSRFTHEVHSGLDTDSILFFAAHRGVYFEREKK